MWCRAATADGGNSRSRPGLHFRPAVAVRERAARTWVLAVAGTHGKTTTSSMLAWILEHAGLKPGFLIGGVPQNFGVSARLDRIGRFSSSKPTNTTPRSSTNAPSSCTTIRAPRSSTISEFDHADIFPESGSDRNAVPPSRAHGAAQRADRRQRQQTRTWHACWRVAAGATWSISTTDRAGRITQTNG